MAMQEKKNNRILLLFSFLLLGSFFIPWVSWGRFGITGYDMPAGHFFSISEKQFSLANPFPQTAPLFAIFWAIPLLALLLIILWLFSKKTGFTAGVAGLLALSLATVYVLFTSILIDLGVNRSVWSTLRPGWYATIISAIGVIAAGIPRRNLLKAALIIAAPAATWAGFHFISGQVEGGTFGSTGNAKTAYTVNGPDLIREFAAADSASNAKYQEKILTVNGRASTTEVVNDSTCNVKIEDTTGSYLIFSFVNETVKEARLIKPGDSISVKGSCSGSIYSDILATEAISFKRCVLNKVK
jgi:hypothetical protein